MRVVTNPNDSSLIIASKVAVPLRASKKQYPDNPARFLVVHVAQSVFKATSTVISDTSLLGI